MRPRGASFRLSQTGAVVALCAVLAALTAAQPAGAERALGADVARPLTAGKSPVSARIVVSRRAVLRALRRKHRLRPKQPNRPVTIPVLPGTTPQPQPPSPKPEPSPASPQPPPAFPQAYRDRVGFSGSIVWYEDAEQLGYLQRLRDLGAGWIREDLHWGAFEHGPGQWNWTVGDRLMRNASLTGINVLGVVSYSAHWAAAGPTIYHPPADIAAYAEFCRRLAERYGPGGSYWQAHPDLSPRPLRALEIWNEPWTSMFWRPNPDPQGYLDLLRAAATAIHAANAEIEVLASADIFQMRTDTAASLDWFRVLLELDPALFRNLVDAYSVHAYTQRRGPYDTSVEQRWRFDRVLMTRDLAARAGASHPIWITEFGWSTSSGNPDAVSEATQALYLRQALERALGTWGSIVPRAFIYHWGRSESDHVGGYGVFRGDSSRKPAWDSLHALLQGQ
jgi:hypothetical protein